MKKMKFITCVTLLSLCLLNAKSQNVDKPSDYMERATAIEKNGDMYFEKGDYNGAITSYNSAIANWYMLSGSSPLIGFVRPELFLKIANSYIAWQNFDSAIENCNEYIEMKPKSGEGFYVRGNARREAKDNEGACNDWKRAELLGYFKSQNKLTQYCK